nr:hypothetical protein [Angustibacter aerolatus]
MWQGGADPLAPPYDVRAAVDRLGEEVLAGGSLRDALRDLLRRGGTDANGERGQGLDDLFERARRMRRDALRRGRLDGTVTRAQALLDQALAAEREALAGRDDDDARFAEAQARHAAALDRPRRRGASPTTSGPATRRAPTTSASSTSLRDEVLQQRFQGMKDALNGADPGKNPEAAQRMGEMLQDLNDLLGKHARGEDTDDAFAEFMDRHGDFFPDAPQDVDELIDQPGPAGRVGRAADAVAVVGAARRARAADAAGAGRHRARRADGRAHRQPALAAPRPALGPR